MFGKVTPLELAIVVLVILLGAVIADQLGFELRLHSTRDFLVFLVIAPLLEEYVFRYQLQKWMSTRWQSPIFALLASSSIFALCHAPWLGWFAMSLLIPGMVLGLYWLRYQSLWYNVALHSMMNGVLATVTMLSQALH